MKHLDLNGGMFDFGGDDRPALLHPASQAHLAVCAECRQGYESLSEAGRLFRSLATAVTRETSCSPEQISDALARCRGLLQSGAAHLPRRNSRIALLHAVLAPLCGRGVASHFIAVAGQQASSSSGLVADPEWSGFLVRVVSQVRRMCGETVAELVLEIAS
jgi:hypothetical protein